jgi:hypothetical protein
MENVKFHIKEGSCIGSYRLVKRVGSGCTAEAYLAKEIPTSAERVLKLYERFKDSQQIKNLRDFEHYCWFLEQISHVSILPRYYHMGHTFLWDADGIGHYYMIQEYLKGTKFSVKKCSEDMVHEFRRKVAMVNKLGYGLGDMTEENLLIVSGQIRMVDCDYGSHNMPNKNAKADTKRINRLFGTEFGALQANA